jgi:spore maturation protein CgeB
MRIFHLGLCVGPPPFDSMRKAFLANSTEYIELSTGEKDVNQKAIAMARAFKPDIVFMQIQAPNIIYIDTVVQLKKTGAFVVNWNGDIRATTPQWMIEMSNHVDKTLFSNYRDVFNVENGGYLEIGYDPEIYKPEGEALKLKEIGFFGNNYGSAMFPLSRMRIEMNNLLSRHFNGRYGVYGNNWHNGSGNFNHSQAEEAKAYRGIKIGINLSHFDEPKYTSDRIYRIMGSGCFCLAKQYAEMPFIDGEHLRVWKTFPELIGLINYYLENENERKQIAKQGNDFVKENYTFDNMVYNLIKIYEQN